MRKPKILDLFCCQGGAGVGYSLAGFDVVGVDINPQPKYPFSFFQADALSFDLSGFDAVHASPPCQRYSNLTPEQSKKNHPDLISSVREKLVASGLPYVIENVAGAKRELLNPVMLCGSMFGLRTRRHRFFECSFPVVAPCVCDHSVMPLLVTTASKASRALRASLGVKPKSVTNAPLAYGINWMNFSGLKEAIPPAYTEYIGKQLRAHVLCAERLPDTAEARLTAYNKAMVRRRKRTSCAQRQKAKRMKPYYDHAGITIYHGDCREIVPQLGRFDLLLTDPPYGVDFKGKATKHTAASGGYVGGDNSDGPDVVSRCLPICECGIVTPGIRLLYDYPKPRDIGCVYCPSGAGVGPWGFTCFHPVLFYGQRRGGPRSPSSFQSFHTSPDFGHPCPKPIEWMKWFIAIAGDVQTILDPFAGSGTTGRAAKDLNRKAVLIEREERYCEIAADRMSQEVLAL